MSTRFEGSFQGHDQIDLFFQLWPSESPRGTMVLTHGLAEHCECYHHLARSLNMDGWDVFGWDLRGHGRSEGKRGFARHLNDFVADLKLFVEFVHRERKAKNGPLVLFGHSMGGLITTRMVLDWKESPPFQALTLSSPLFGIAVPVPKIKDQVARLSQKWFPSLTLYNEIKYTDLTHDEAMIKSYARDVLRHDKISPGIYLGMVENIEFVREHARELTLPVLMLLAGHDKIVSTPAAQETFDLLPNKKNALHLFPESYHEIFNDMDREQATSDLKKFINSFLGAP